MKPFGLDKLGEHLQNPSLPSCQVTSCKLQVIEVTWSFTLNMQAAVASILLGDVTGSSCSSGTDLAWKHANDCIKAFGFPHPWRYISHQSSAPFAPPTYTKLRQHKGWILGRWWNLDKPNTPLFVACTEKWVENLDMRRPRMQKCIYTLLCSTKYCSNYKGCIQFIQIHGTDYTVFAPGRVHLQFRIIGPNNGSFKSPQSWPNHHPEKKHAHLRSSTSCSLSQGWSFQHIAATCAALTHTHKAANNLSVSE